MNKVIIKAYCIGTKGGAGWESDTYNFRYTLKFLFDDNNSHRVQIKKQGLDIIYDDIVYNNQTVELTEDYFYVRAYENNNIDFYFRFDASTSLFYNNGSIAKRIVLNGIKNNDEVTISSDVLTKITNSCPTENVELYSGYILYTTDGTDPSYNIGGSTNEWLEGETKIIPVPYTIKARYIAALNHPHCRSNIITIEKGNLLPPQFEYNQETGYLTVINNSEGTLKLTTRNGYTEPNPYNIRNVLDTFTEVVSTYNFIKLKAYTYTTYQTSDIVYFDVSNIESYISKIIPNVSVQNNFIKFDIDSILNEPGVSAYYTTDNTTPDKNSNEYTGLFQVNRNVKKIKVIYYIYNIESLVKEYDYEYQENPDLVIEGDPEITYTGGEKILRHNTTLKSYIDILDNKDFENIKILNSISYVLYQIENKYSPINISEELLNRRFSGNNILIYTDETYSGLLDINITDYVNKIENNTKPVWYKGVWHFNYFRNYINKTITTEDLRSFCNFKYYNSKTNTLEDATISINKLQKLYKTNALNIAQQTSDLKSLIYGKYFIVRFIFDNNTNVKLEDIEFHKNVEV